MFVDDLLNVDNKKIIETELDCIYPNLEINVEGKG